MTKSPKISIILPIHNAGDYLRPCLDTLINQSLQEIEILCVLDCPTDGSDKIVEEYAATDKRIVLIKNNHNKNIGESRNVGILAARGEYIGFSDHDDTHKQTMYEELYAATEEGTKEAVFSGVFAQQILSTTSLFSQYPPLQKAFLTLLVRDGIPRFCGHVTPHLYNRSFLLENNITFVDTKETCGEDRIFLESIISCIKKENDVAWLNKRLYLYRLHDMNAHTQKWYGDIPHTLNFVKKMIEVSRNTDFADRQLVNHLIARFLIQTVYTSNRKYRNEPGEKDYKTLIKEDKALCNLIAYASILSLRLTIPKTLFAIRLKYICRSQLYNRN